MKTTDVSEGNAIFLIGRPESHIQNVTLDNVQISAKKGIDIRFVDNLVFKNNSKITCTSGDLWIRSYDSTVDDQCNATGKEPSPSPGKSEEVTYTLSKQTCTLASGDGSTTWTFDNGCSISSKKGYATASSNTIKYSKGVEFTINLPEGASITSVTFAGYCNEDNKTCYLGELNGTSFEAETYVFPSRTTTKDTSTSFEIPLATPATGSFTFKPLNGQAAWVITLKGTATSTGIATTTADSKAANHNVYDLNGRLLKSNATAEDLGKLSKGVYIYNNKKYISK